MRQNGKGKENILTNIIKFEMNIPYFTTCEQQSARPETPIVTVNDRCLCYYYTTFEIL